MHVKKHLNFNALIKTLAELFDDIEDRRQEGKVDYRLHDCLMSVLAMMHFQAPSLLSFQHRLRHRRLRENVKTMFGIGRIGRDTQLRETLDHIPSQELYPAFSLILKHLQRGRQLERFALHNKMYLVCIDGSQYFSSQKIHCPQCLRRKGARGALRYSHQILQSVIVHPQLRQVLPLAPEAIENTDGSTKQDCELNAAKRAIKKIRKAHPKLAMVVTADGLYSKQPFIEQLKSLGFSFILVAKEADHKHLFEWVDDMVAFGEAEHMQLFRDKERRDVYRWVNQVPINGKQKTQMVNFIEYQLQKQGKTTYRNTWVTDITVSRKNVVELVKGGRARWKIENETFNTLKNQGYHIEHNFGHGTRHLSMNFFTLNLLAFYLHQILQLCDTAYQQCRSQFSSRKEYFNDLRAALRWLPFSGYYHLLATVTDPEQHQPP